MRIVQLTPGDEALLDIAARQFRGVEGVDQSSFLRDPATVVLLMMNDADVVGWAWGLRQRHVCGYTQLQLYEVGVAEPMRRRGVGRELVGAFLEIARTEGHEKMWLITTEDNIAAKNLYQAMGGGPAGYDKARYWWDLA
jgi:ribosomal protein S18 acetylase RimI-like enzyme